MITFNNSTTTLDAISMNKPVISLQTDSYANEDDIAQAGAILSISEIKELENGIKKILYDNDFKKKLMEKSDLFLQKYMKTKVMRQNRLWKF